MPITQAEVDAAVKRAFSIPGLYRRSEAAYLYSLARRKGHIVEIGCWMGRTTSLLVQAASIWGAEVTTVDPFTPMPARHAQGSPEKWRANLRKLKLPAPRLLTSPSHVASLVVDGPLSMVFIDGDHSQDAVLTDLRDWTPKVKVGGVVALHDMFYPTIPGVATAVAAWWAGHRDQWEFIGLKDFTVAFKRTA